MSDMGRELKLRLNLSQDDLKTCVGDEPLKFVHMATLGETILSARLRKKLTQQQLGALLSVTGSTVSQWENNQTVPMPKKVAPLCRALDLDRAMVDSLLDAYHAASDASPELALPKPRTFRDPLAHAPRATADVQNPTANRRPDVPVWASAAGSEEGTMILTESPIDFIQRSELMRDTVNPFAFFVIGDSMSEVIEHGDQVVVNPSRLPQPGKDHVFIHEGEGIMLATVKRLVRVKADAWRVKQFNPEKEFDLPKNKWGKALRITEKRYAS